MTTTKTYKRISLKRQQSLVRRVNRIGQRIDALSEQKREALAVLAQGCNLGTIEVDGVKFIVVKPKAHYVFYREWDLKELPKNPRSPKPETEISPTAEAGV